MTGGGKLDPLDHALRRPKRSAQASTRNTFHGRRSPTFGGDSNSRTPRTADSRSAGAAAVGSGSSAGDDAGVDDDIRTRTLAPRRSIRLLLPYETQNP